MARLTVTAISLAGLAVHSHSTAQGHRTSSPSALTEDLDGDRKVTDRDVSVFDVLRAGQDMKADIDGDGVLTDADAERMRQAVAWGMESRLLLPDALGFEAIGAAHFSGGLIAIYRHSTTTETVYAVNPADARSGPVPPTELLGLAGGGVLSLHYGADGALASVWYAGHEQPSAQIQEAPRELIMEITVAEIRARPLPPIGTCPSCVPLQYPAGWRPCRYLYSKWSFDGRCLVDVFGCDDTQDLAFVFACCDDPVGDQTDCP